MAKVLNRIVVSLVALASLAQSESMLKDKEHLDIYYNKHADNVSKVIEASDKLTMFYVCHTGLEPEQQQQNWAILDNMIAMVLEQLEGGYLETYVYDCGTLDLENVDPSVSIG